MTGKFLRYKMREYEALREELESLRKEHETETWKFRAGYRIADRYTLPSPGGSLAH